MIPSHLKPATFRCITCNSTIIPDFLNDSTDQSKGLFVRCPNCFKIKEAKWV